MALIIGLCWGLGGAFLLVIIAAVGRRNRQAKIEALRALARNLPDEELDVLIEQYKDDL